MGEPCVRTRFSVTCGLLPGSFRGHPGLFFPCMARLLYSGYSAHHYLPFGTVAIAHETCFSAPGLSEPDRAFHIRAVADLILLGRSTAYGYRYECQTAEAAEPPH